jgi:membrane-associated protein
MVLLCGLLFVEETGVPLPFAPGELVLVAGGLLIASGGLNPLAFVPLATIACVSGSLVGFSWAGLVGPNGLHSLARRIHRQKGLERVEARVQSAGVVGIAATRLIPGLRIYTTLVAGALRISRRRFLLGMVPATAVWVVVFVILGAAVGLPVAHFFNQVQKLAVQGVILIAIGVGGYFAIRHTPASAGSGLTRVPRGLRVGLAAAIDVGVVTSVVTGVLALARRLLDIGLGAGWFDGAVALFIVALFYVLIARHGAGATVGEALLQTPYVSGRRIPLRPRALLQVARDLLAGSVDELLPTAELFRALGDPERLRVVRHLADIPRTADELEALSGVPLVEVQHAVGRLQAVGILVAEGEGPGMAYRVRPALLAPMLEILALSQSPPDEASGMAPGYQESPVRTPPGPRSSRR